MRKLYLCYHKSSQLNCSCDLSPLIIKVNKKYDVIWDAQFSSVAQSCPPLCDPMNSSTPSLPVRHQLPEFTQTHVHRVGDAIQPFHPLSSPSAPTLIPPSIRVFSNESSLRMRWPKYWSFSFSISTLNEHPGLISFRTDWSLVCHESFVYCIFCCSDVFNLHAVKSVSFFLYAFLSIVSSPQQDCGNTIIFFLPIQEHGICFHLFVCL